MPVVEESVLVQSPPEAVFAFLSDPANVPRWDTSAVSVEQVDDGPLTTGTRWRGVTKVMGRRFDWVTEVTEVDEPRVLASRSIEGSIAFSVRYTLRPESGGTRLTYRVEAESGLGRAFGRFADSLVQGAFARAARGSLSRLAELLSRSPVG